jgi:hypothetical protein
VRWMLPGNLQQFNPSPRAMQTRRDQVRQRRCSFESGLYVNGRRQAVRAAAHPATCQAGQVRTAGVPRAGGRAR